MPTRNTRLNSESWHICVSCDTECQLNNLLLINEANDIECPYCGGHEFEVSTYHLLSDEYNNYDYSTYDEYDSYY